MSDQPGSDDSRWRAPVPTAYRVMDPDVPFHRSWMTASGPTLALWQHFAEMSGDAFKVAAFIACRTSANAGQMDGIVRGVLLRDAEAHTGLDEHRLVGAVAELESRGLIEVWQDMTRDEPAMSLATARREAIAWLVREQVKKPSPSPSKKQSMARVPRSAKRQPDRAAPSRSRHRKAATVEASAAPDT